MKPAAEPWIRIRLNGSERELPEGLTVGVLLRQLELAPERVAVEVNLDVIPRARYEGTRLQQGDRVEIVTFVGGG